ncbi:MAG: RecX family transcriptional regulator, partial [Endomicrobia bacterium]|nr:RecX family transcriptional regulator [Endomicrobiia bacterium]
MKNVFQEAYEYSCKLLKIRDRSEYELKQKLIQKGFSQKVILKVIDKLKNNLYLNEKKFITNYIESQIKKLKPLSLILKELKENFKIDKRNLEDIDFSFYKKLQFEIIKKFIEKKFKNFEEYK